MEIILSVRLKYTQTKSQNKALSEGKGMNTPTIKFEETLWVIIVNYFSNS